MRRKLTGYIIVRLRPEGQTAVFSIPAEIREALALKPGDMMAAAALRGNLVARKVPMEETMRELARAARQAGKG